VSPRLVAGRGQLWLSRHVSSQACLLRSPNAGSRAVPNFGIVDFHRPWKKNWGKWWMRGSSSKYRISMKIQDAQSLLHMHVDLLLLYIRFVMSPWNVLDLQLQGSGHRLLKACLQPQYHAFRTNDQSQECESIWILNMSNLQFQRGTTWAEYNVLHFRNL